MSLFIFSLEENFSNNIKDIVEYGLDYTDYEAVYIHGLAPISIIVSELCKEKEIINYVFLPKLYRKQGEIDKDINTMLLNATASMFLPCRSTNPELYNKEIQKYLLEISQTKICLANNHDIVVSSMQSIIEAGGDYVLLPS